MIRSHFVKDGLIYSSNSKKIRFTDDIPEKYRDTVLDIERDLTTLEWKYIALCTDRICMWLFFTLMFLTSFWFFFLTVNSPSINLRLDAVSLENNLESSRMGATEGGESEQKLIHKVEDRPQNDVFRKTKLKISMPHGG